MTRRKPDATRKGMTRKVRVARIELYVTLNTYDDDEPCELFIKAHGQQDSDGEITGWREGGNEYQPSRQAVERTFERRRSRTLEMIVGQGVTMDKLNMEHINSLPQPFIVRFFGGDEWLVHDIDVETGLLRIDVFGKLQVKHIGEASFFRDMDGTEHDAETFYSDYVPNAPQQGRRSRTLPAVVGRSESEVTHGQE